MEAILAWHPALSTVWERLGWLANSCCIRTGPIIHVEWKIVLHTLSFLIPAWVRMGLGEGGGGVHKTLLRVNLSLSLRNCQKHFLQKELPSFAHKEFTIWDHPGNWETCLTDMKTDFLRFIKQVITEIRNQSVWTLAMIHVREQRRGCHQLLHFAGTGQRLNIVRFSPIPSFSPLFWIYEPLLTSVSARPLLILVSLSTSSQENCLFSWSNSTWNSFSESDDSSSGTNWEQIFRLQMEQEKEPKTWEASLPVECGCRWAFTHS